MNVRSDQDRKKDKKLVKAEKNRFLHFLMALSLSESLSVMVFFKQVARSGSADLAEQMMDMMGELFRSKPTPDSVLTFETNDIIKLGPFFEWILPIAVELPEDLRPSDEATAAAVRLHYDDLRLQILEIKQAAATR